ncbi:MAG: ABC transporter ATP-binding protein/permease [Pseudomonadota bacterium]|nr:ABC transporter ATP-binding protein/permease [Pseudomonadota bacterium]QKK06163.1 MAG: ABC transporter ATP-binding protein/permease [Pseudomonadota bacterium]
MKNDKTEKQNSQWRTLGTLIPYLWPKGENEIKLRVLLAIIALICAKVTNVYMPLLYKKAVDALTVTPTETLVLAVPTALLLAYGGARVMTVVFQELREALFAKVTQRAMRRVALETFQHLHALSMRFHITRQTGGLSRVIERGVKGIEFLMSFMLFNIVPTLVEIFMVCGVLWYMFNFWYALVTFVTIFAYIAFTLVSTEWRLKFRRSMNERDTEANTKAVDSLLNYETVKYFSNEDHESRRYDVALAGYEEAAVKSITSLSVVNIGQAAIISAGLVIVMYMAGGGVVAGNMTLGDFVLVNTYLIQLYLPLNFLGFVYRQIRQSLTDMEDMFSMLRIDREIKDADNAKPLAVNGGKIEFEDVHFSYDAKRDILKGVGFTVEPGKTIAVVGPSGAGKSTISRLMFRFYDVNDGAVRIDGQDLRDVTQDSLRAAIGIVPQDTVLFNDTIRYNIAYGRPGATEEEVIRAAKLAHIDEFIRKLPEGYDALVGERGLKLSGGEKQRVAIARTILKNPPILLFDEATSALDSATEQDILKSLKEVSEGRTTLVIAHRLSTVTSADEILVLDEGGIVERGSHKQLLKKKGVYADMWQRQQ